MTSQLLLFQEKPGLAQVLKRRGTGHSLSTRTGPWPSPIHPSSESRLPAQPRRRERGFSFTDSCPLPGKQGRCQKLYPDGEGKRGQDTAGAGGPQEKDRILRKSERSGQHGYPWKQFHKKYTVLKALKRPTSMEVVPPALRPLSLSPNCRKQEAPPTQKSQKCACL